VYGYELAATPIPDCSDPTKHICDNICSNTESLWLQPNGSNMGFWLFWAFLLVFTFHSMDRTPKDWICTQKQPDGSKKTMFSWLHLYVYVMGILTVGWWYVLITSIDILETGLMDPEQPLGYDGFTIGTTRSPLGLILFNMFGPVALYLLLHEPCYWPQVIIGYISSLFTGAIVTSIPSMQNPLVIMYTMANLDSTNWGTRATADHGLYGGDDGEQDTGAYKKQLWRTKLVLLLLWLCVNLTVSFLAVYGYLIWGNFYFLQYFNGLDWMPWLLTIMMIFLIAGRYLDWFMGRLLLFQRERARKMKKLDTLGSILNFVLRLRVMSCSFPCEKMHLEEGVDFVNTSLLEQDDDAADMKQPWYGTSVKV